jgi:hypothetical protein
LRCSDKVRAIVADNDLAGNGAQAKADDPIRELLRRVRK